MPVPTRKVTNYTIVTASTAAELKGGVNKLIKEGWQLYGSHFQMGGTINQPMVVYEKGVEFFALVDDSYVPASQISSD